MQPFAICLSAQSSPTQWKQNYVYSLLCNTVYISILEVNGFSAGLDTFANNLTLVNELESLMKSTAALTEENDLTRAPHHITYTHSALPACMSSHKHYTGCHWLEWIFECWSHSEASAGRDWASGEAVGRGMNPSHRGETDTFYYFRLTHISYTVYARLGNTIGSQAYVKMYHKTKRQRNRWVKHLKHSTLLQLE